jgi:hypothetical protein
MMACPFLIRVLDLCFGSSVLVLDLEAHDFKKEPEERFLRSPVDAKENLCCKPVITAEF